MNCIGHNRHDLEHEITFLIKELTVRGDLCAIHSSIIIMLPAVEEKRTECYKNMTRESIRKGIQGAQTQSLRK